MFTAFNISCNTSNRSSFIYRILHNLALAYLHGTFRSHKTSNGFPLWLL